jgi:Protein of unknown function (DUF3987)/Bifunctional DNA primase/polymerase, N-terminal/Primase C terminal 2 (PriCT-2)
MQNSNSTSTKIQRNKSCLNERLIDGLRRIQATNLELPLVPLNGNKQPLGDGWQNRAFSTTQLIEAISNGGVEVPIKGKIKKIQLKGFGLITGGPIAINGATYNIMALDQDGEGAAAKIEKLSAAEPLPKTVAFTSGRPARCQYLFLVPEEYKNVIRTKKINTGVKDEDKKVQKLEFRWKDLQSVLPPSIHPTTGEYYWVEGCAIDEVEIAIAPPWVIEQMLIEPELPTTQPSLFSERQNFTKYKQWTDIDFAISYLNALSKYRADDYDEWLTVGMALHSVDDSLVFEWDKWSTQSAKYRPGDCEKKWRSFSPNGGVSLGTLSHMAKQDGWHFPFTKQTYRAGESNSPISFSSTQFPNLSSERTLTQKSEKDTVFNNTYSNGNDCRGRFGNSNRTDGERKNDRVGRINEINMRSSLKEILDLHLAPSELTEAFNSLALASGWNVREIRAVFTEIEGDLDLEDSRGERRNQLLELENYRQSSLDLTRFLPASIATPMTKMARWMEAPPAALLTGLLPATASCLHPSTRIVVKESIGFVEAPIIYAGIVTESGQRKSPLMNAIIDPLQELQAQEEERYKREQDEYELEYEYWQAQKKSMSEAEWKNIEPTPPAPLKEFYIDKATIEAIDKIKSSQPDTSLLWKKDELSGLLNSYNAYKGGRGEDKESVLSGWNGRGVKKNLKGGERVSLKQDSLSIFGAIQDVTLQKKMGNFEDEQGEWGRFLWCLIPLKPLRLPDDDTSFFLSFLQDLYQRARNISPAFYRFSPAAQKLYNDYHWELEQRRVSHPQRGMRAAIAKMEGYTARLALMLHLIWELEAGTRTPSLQVPSQRVEAAISLVEFYLSQVILIHSEGAAANLEEGLTPRLSTILDKLYQFKELTARKLQSAISWLRKEKPGNIRNYLIELSKLGYGKLVGAGNRLKLVLTVDGVEPTVDRTVDRGDSSQTITNKEIESLSKRTVESVERSNDRRVERENNRHSFLLDEQIKKKSDEDLVLKEISKVLVVPTVESESIDNDRHSQQLDSSSLNHELSGTLAADDLSTESTTVARNENSSEPPRFLEDARVSTSVGDVLKESKGDAKRVERINRLTLRSIIISTKVFTHLIENALHLKPTAVEPDLFTSLAECGGLKSLGTMLLRCQTSEALAVLRSVFPRVLLYESLTYISQSSEEFQRLRALDGGKLASSPVYVYCGETEARGDIRAGNSGRERLGYLQPGILVIDTVPPHSIPELAYVKIVSNPDSSFQVKRSDLMLLKPSDF